MKTGGEVMIDHSYFTPPTQQKLEISTNLYHCKYMIWETPSESDN